MSEAPVLLALQKTDGELDKLSARLAALADTVGLTAAKEQRARLSGQLEEVGHELEALRRRQRSMEGELGVVEAKIAREEGRLYSGTITNPKELRGIQGEVESLKKKRDGFETDLLQVMEEIDPVEDSFVQLTQALSEAEAKRVAAQEAYDEESAEIGKAVAGLNQEREGLVEKLSSGALGLYTTLRRDKAGVAVAVLEGETCGGCRVELPAGELEAVRRSVGPARCPNCRRILLPGRLL